MENSPTYIEIQATDRLITGSGAESGESQWVFWLSAPADWADANDLGSRTERIAEKIYAAMNARLRESEEDDGSAYQVLGVAHRVLSAAEIAAAPWNAKGKTLYRVSKNETVNRVSAPPGAEAKA